MSALIDALRDRISDGLAMTADAYMSDPVKVGPIRSVFEAMGQDLDAALAAAEAQPKPVGVYMGYYSTPEGTKEFWGIADMPMPMGTKLYAAPVAQQVVPQGWRKFVQKAHDVDGHCDVVLAADLGSLTAAPAAPAAQPLTDAAFCEEWHRQTGRIMGADKGLLIQAKCVTERAHGITGSAA